MRPTDIYHGPEKQCESCLEWWPADGEFYRRERQAADSLDHLCRACRAALPWWLTHRDRQEEPCP